MKPKRNKKKKRKSPCLGSCFDCTFANCIGEGDFLCDVRDIFVISDWMPTENYYICQGKTFKPV